MGRQSKNLRDFRKQVAALRRAGLVSKRVDPKRQADTAYMRAQIRKYKDVLEGRAKTVQTNTLSTARAISEEYRQLQRKGKTIIVPVATEKSKVSYSPKDRSIVIERKISGKRRKTRLVPMDEKGEPRKKSPSKNKTTFYVVRFANGGSISFDEYSDLEKFMSQYETGNRKDRRGRLTGEKGWDDWREYVEEIEVDNDELGI